MANPLDDSGISYKISYKDHSLHLETPEFRRDNDTYTRDYEGVIEAIHWDDEDDEGRTEVAGYISYSIVKIGMLRNDGANLYDFFDSDGWLYEIGECLFDWETHDLKEEITGVIDEPLNSNLLVIHDLQLLPKFRGRRLGLEIMKCLVDEYADSCGFAFLDIYPCQLWDGMDEARRSALQLDGFDHDETRALKRLTDYFHQINFRKVPGTSYLAFHLDYEVPEIEEE